MNPKKFQKRIEQIIKNYWAPDKDDGVLYIQFLKDFVWVNIREHCNTPYTNAAQLQDIIRWANKTKGVGWYVAEEGFIISLNKETLK